MFNTSTGITRRQEVMGEARKVAEKAGTEQGGMKKKATKKKATKKKAAQKKPPTKPNSDRTHYEEDNLQEKESLPRPAKS